MMRDSQTRSTEARVGRAALEEENERLRNIGKALSARRRLADALAEAVEEFDPWGDTDRARKLRAALRAYLEERDA